ALAKLTPAKRAAFVSALSRVEADALARDWDFWSHEAQRAPPGDWSTWLFMGGRGAGKTRAGAEFIREEVERGRATRIALLGETERDVRKVMIEGVSGLLAVPWRIPRPIYRPSQGELIFPGHGVAQCFSAETPDALRGPQFDLAWCDEFAKWAFPEETWDML